MGKSQLNRTQNPLLKAYGSLALRGPGLAGERGTGSCQWEAAASFPWGDGLLLVRRGYLFPTESRFRPQNRGIESTAALDIYKFARRPFRLRAKRNCCIE